MNIIEVKNLSFGYSGSQVLCDLSFELKQGSFMAIAGPNGAGKTTLLNLLSGSLKPQAGSIKIAGKDLKSYTSKTLAQKAAVVRQEFVPVFGFSVLETVLMARTLRFRSTGFESQSDRDIANEALKATDTAQFATRQLGQISGGERQRVFIARALAQETPLLLLDEPTSFLDLHHQVQIYDLLKQMQLEKDKTIIAITHDINLASQYCDTVLLLATDGDYHKGPAGEVFSPEKIKNVFKVTGFSGMVADEKFFLPLGRLAKDRK